MPTVDCPIAGFYNIDSLQFINILFHNNLKKILSFIRYSLWLHTDKGKKQREFSGRRFGNLKFTIRIRRDTDRRPIDHYRDTR